MILQRREARLVACAFAKARWMCKDALARRSRASAAEVLLAHAAETACSPDGRDQLLSLGLTAGAADIVAGRTPLDRPPSVTLDRSDAFASVASAARFLAVENGEAARLAAQLAERICGEVALIGIRPGAARRLLNDCAALQGGLCRAPEIPATDLVRAVMQLSAPLIRGKANELNGFLKKRR